VKTKSTSRRLELASTEQDRELRREQTIDLPSDSAQLEEANLPRDLAIALTGKTKLVELLWEKSPDVRRGEPWDTDMLIDPGGKWWSEYYPLQVFFRDDCGKVWRLPRHLVSSNFDCLQPWTPQPDPEYRVTFQHTLFESIHLPSFWDLLEINIPRELAIVAAGKPTKVQVRLSPGSPVRVTWSAPMGIEYVIPHTWRRRRVQLPDRGRLTEEGVPDEVAAIYAGRIVSVNYHPGSLCCLLEHYRFRDEQGARWPVKIRDCFLIGYGDANEHPVF
jgi:hypothetical protein